MAQELSDKIRAAAQARGIDPEIALRIARAESAVNPAAQAKTSSAGGLFQVVDKTWKEFGGKPGKKYDPDENIRVGTDIIAKNTQTLRSFLNRDPRPAEIYAAHYFGPSGAKTFLSAEPGTPMESIFSKEVIRANPNLKGKTSGQVLAQLEKKMGSSPAAPAPARQANVSRETPPQKFLEPNPLEPLAPAAQAPLAPANKLASLGPGYQAALALSFLADTDEKEDRDVEKEPGIAEKWLAESATASRPAALAGFDDIKIRSPFAEPAQPQMLAEGGEVGEESMGSKILKEVVPMDLRILGSTLMGNRDPITESNFNKEELAAMQQAVDKAAARTGKTEKGSVQYVDYPKGDEIGPGYQPVGHTLGRFVYEKGPNGQTVITDKYDFYNEGRKANVEKYEKMGPIEKPLSVSANMLRSLFKGDLRQIPAEIAEAYIGRDGRDVRIQLPVKRADGGDAEPTPEELEAASRPATVNPNIQRQGEAARRLAAMRDVNTLPDPRTYAAVSGFLGQAPDELGFSVMHPDREGIKKAGQAGFGVGTALQVAPVMGALRAAGIGPSSGGKTASAASQLGAIKPRGGHFAVEGKTYGGPREQGQRFAQADPDGGRVEVIQNYVNTYLANTNDQLLNEWMQNKVAPYMRRDMGTEMDQFVRAADEGRKLHFINKPTTEGYTGPHMSAWMKNARMAEGFPEEGFAKTPYGQNVEMITDRVPSPVALDEAYESSIPPGLKQFVKTDPNMRMYELNFHGLDALNLIELRDKMAKMRQMSPEFSKYSQPAVKVPEQYLFTDKSLQGLTPAQASERVAQFDAWKDQTQQKMASRAAFVDPNISRTPSSEGHVWVNPPDLERNPALRELIQDVGCDGGWCTKGENYALSYGSGENRLTVLMDSKARPRAQMTIKSAEPNADDFLLSMDDVEAARFDAAYPDLPLYDAKTIMGTSEYQEWLARNPPTMSITEIKGVNNQADLKNASYLKQIQQRVKDLDAQFGLQSVDNLEGINMFDVDQYLPSLSLLSRSSLGRPLSPEQESQLSAFMRNLNNGSRYVDKNEGKNIFNEADRIVRPSFHPPQQRATGGMIERQSTDNRRYL
jgi:hypothetical protein